jgi:hypothetical protein
MDECHKPNKEDAAAGRTHETVATQKRKASDRRIERLEDLLAEALKEPDPLRASLRAATADLLEIGYRLGTGIKAAMGAESGIAEKMFEAVTPAVNTLALVHRQATRYVQLDRDRASDENSTGGKKRQQRTAESGEIEI